MEPHNRATREKWKHESESFNQATRRLQILYRRMMAAGTPGLSDMEIAAVGIDDVRGVRLQIKRKIV